MIEKTTREFLADAEDLLIGAVANDDFLTVKTAAGNAVIISEAEWNILIDAFKMLYNGQYKKAPSRCWRTETGNA